MENIIYQLILDTTAVVSIVSLYIGIVLTALDWYDNNRPLTYMVIRIYILGMLIIIAILVVWVTSTCSVKDVA